MLLLLLHHAQGEEALKVMGDLSGTSGGAGDKAGVLSSWLLGRDHGGSIWHEFEGISFSESHEARVAAATVHVHVQGRQSEVDIAVLVFLGIVVVCVRIIPAAAWIRCFVRG